MIKCSAVTPQHSIVFIADMDSDVEVPADTSAATVTFTDSCVAVWTLPEDEGPTTVCISDSEASDLIVVFDGSIRAPNGLLSIHTSDHEVILSCGVPRGTVPAKVLVDDLQYPGRIALVIPGLRRQVDL